MENRDNKPSTPSEDDDPITTSTDSEIFGTWTVVREKNKSQISEINNTNNSEELREYVTAVDEAANRVQELKRNEQHECERQDAEVVDMVYHSHKSEQETSLDDLSDGISVISDSDSAGHMTPHPLLRQQLSDLNLKIAKDPEFDLSPLKHMDPLIAASTSLQEHSDFQLKQRRRKRSSSSNALQTAAAEITAVGPLDSTPVHLPPIVRKGLTGLFYGIVLLSVVSFVGRLFNPAWGPIASSKPLAQMEQKLTDMELQNNLMRAEIDILTKQVNYLSSFKDQQRSLHQDFKSKPYKMKPNIDMNAKSEENFKQQVPNYIKHADTVDDQTKNSGFVPAETMSDFVKIADELEKLMDNPYAPGAGSVDKIDPNNKDINLKQNEQKENESHPNRSPYKGEKNDERKMEFKFNKDHSKSYTERRPHSNFEESSKEKFRHTKSYKPHVQQSHEHDSHEDDDGDDDDDDDDHSKEHKQRFAKYQRDHNSRERFNKNERHVRQAIGENHSKERSGKKFKDYDESYKRNGKNPSPADNKDGQWHEKYMEHRANERRNSERQRNDKNWYIERGDSREQVRHVDHHFR